MRGSASVGRKVLYAFWKRSEACCLLSVLLKTRFGVGTPVQQVVLFGCAPSLFGYRTIIIDNCSSNHATPNLQLPIYWKSSFFLFGESFKIWNLFFFSTSISLPWWFMAEHRMRFVVVIISCKKSHKYPVTILTRDLIFCPFFWVCSVMFKTKGNEMVLRLMSWKWDGNNYQEEQE